MTAPYQLNKGSRTMPRTFKIVLLMVFASALLSGCNTARGVGEDIKDLGHAISHAAS